MEILIKPRKFIGCTSWQSKLNGVILVEKEADIELLWKLLIEQEMIIGKAIKKSFKLPQKEIDDEGDIARMCVYVGKTDIYSQEELQAKVPFIMYQEYPVCDGR